MKNRFKVALVGCGGISKNHLNAIKLEGGADVVALCDVIESRAIEKRDMFDLSAKI